MNKELKPCPFCGSKATIREVGLDGWRIHCSSEGKYRGCLTFGDSIMTEKEIIKAWNTRVKEKS